MFVVACIFSPCCAPLLVPVALALLAGTPLAAWLGMNLGWVYGGLTLVSVISLVLGIRWLRR
jgi:predicted MFS family arabinose efflux permease